MMPSSRGQTERGANSYTVKTAPCPTDRPRLRPGAHGRSSYSQPPACLLRVEGGSAGVQSIAGLVLKPPISVGSCCASVRWSTPSISSTTRAADTWIQRHSPGTLNKAVNEEVSSLNHLVVPSPLTSFPCISSPQGLRFCKPLPALRVDTASSLLAVWHSQSTYLHSEDWLCPPRLGPEPSTTSLPEPAPSLPFFGITGSRGCSTPSPQHRCWAGGADTVSGLRVRESWLCVRAVRLDTDRLPISS